jgi:hypothetical protein
MLVLSDPTRSHDNAKHLGWELIELVETSHRHHGRSDHLRVIQFTETTNGINGCRFLAILTLR